MFIILSIIAATIVAGVLYVQYSPQFGGTATGASLEKIRASQQFKDGRFVNSIESPVMAPKSSTSEIMRDYFKKVPDRIPSGPIPLEKVTKSFFKNCEPNQINIAWLGHSAVLIAFEGMFFLTDPMFGTWASPAPFLGPKRFSDELALEISDIPKLDGVIISHDHYDHLDYKTIIALEPKTDRFYMPLGVGAHFKRWGIPAQKIIEKDWWETTMVSQNIQLVTAPSRHFSGRGLKDRNKSLWASWIIKSDNHKLYFSGDSGYSPHFKEIGDKYGPFDLTLMECGAYSENWPYVHMIPEQTAQAHLDVQGKVLLPIHWAQFKLSTHVWFESIERLLKKAKQGNITVASPKIGESFNLNATSPTSCWWEMNSKYQEK